VIKINRYRVIVVDSYVVYWSWVYKISQKRH